MINFMLQLNQGEICRFSRITFHVSVVAKFPLQEQYCVLLQYFNVDFITPL